MDFHLNPDSSGSEIGLSVFLIINVSVGLLALVWAFSLLHLHRNIRGHISAFIVLLLLSGLIQLLINLYTVTQLLTGYIHWYHYMQYQFWSALSFCGFHLHQLVALEGVLTQKYPLCSAHIFSRPCYIIISILVMVFSTVSASAAYNPKFGHFSFSLGTSLAPLILLAMTFTITCKASSTPVSNNTRSVFTVAIVNFVMLYLPFMLIICSDFRVRPPLIFMSHFLMSLRVISDPLLCVLVCRGNLRDVQTPQTHTEPNSDEISV